MKKEICARMGIATTLFGLLLVPAIGTNAATKNVYVTKGEKQTVKVKNATKKVKWKSSKSSVVKVKSAKKGFTIQAKKMGSATVKGKVNGKNYKFKVTVETPKIDKKSVSLQMGETATVKISGTKRKVNWVADDVVIAGVGTKSGKITPNAIGSTYVYAKIGKKKYKCKVTVKDTINLNVVKIPNGKCSIYAKVYSPKEAGTYPVIIMCHGYNGIADDFTSETQYYARNGYIACAIDFCGGSARSRSTGLKTTEMTIFTEKSDLIATFDYFSKQDGVDKNRIFIMGGSQGGLVASLAAEDLKDRARGMILYFPALGLADNWRRTYPDVNKIPATVSFWGMTLGRDFFATIHDLYPFNVIGGFEKPVYIFQGDKDNIVPLSDSKRVAQKYKNAKLKVLEGEGHGFRPAAGKIAMQESLKFMEENK